MKILAVIPARLASTRLPRKLLLAATGKPLIQYVWEVATSVPELAEVIIAADDAEIVTAVERFGGHAVLTGDHPSGTDRVAEVVRSRSDVDLVVNLQGDEPELDAGSVSKLVAVMTDERTEMSTLATPFTSAEEVRDPGNVKCVRAADGRALYFSREPIPHVRDDTVDGWFANAAGGSREDGDLPVQHCPWLLHLGIYAYRREFLLALAEMPPSPLEQFEKLEQLRALEAGATIRVAITPHRSVGIDTRADYDRFVARQSS